MIRRNDRRFDAWHNEAFRVGQHRKILASKRNWACRRTWLGSDSNPVALARLIGLGLGDKDIEAEVGPMDIGKREIFNLVKTE